MVRFLQKRGLNKIGLEQNKFRLAAPLLAGATLLIFSACKREQITSYDIPKEKPVETIAADAAPGSPPAEVHWTVPTGWQELKASGMRVGAFAISTNGQQAEVSVTPLPGVSGIELDSVNMWRQTASLPPLTPETFAKAGQRVAVGPVEGTLFDVTPDANGTNKTHIVGAIAQRSGTLWFFKMAGADPLVSQQKGKFEEFLKSLTFSPVDQTKVAASGPVSTNTKRVPPSESTEARHWALPDGWIEQPASQMVLAKYLVATAAGKAEVSVSMFAGETGGLLANVNRWRGQMGLAPIEEPELGSATQQVEVGGNKAVLVQLSGKNVRAGTNADMLGLIVPRGDNTWFYKIVGDAPVVASQKEAFLKFAAQAK